MKILAVVDKNLGLGYKNKLLYDLPSDKKLFKEKTLGKTVIMGRKTLESLPEGKPLPGRRNIVLTTNKGYDGKGAELCGSLNELFGKIGNGDDTFVIGGGEIYRLLLPYCDEAYITQVEAVKEADCFFPDLFREEGWFMKERGPDQRENGVTFRILRFALKEREQLPFTANFIK